MARACFWLGRTVARRPGWSLGLALVLTGLLGVSAARLRVDTDLVSLLPSDGEHTGAYREFLQRFGGLEEVYVVLGFAQEVPPSKAREVAVASGVLLEALGWLETQLADSDVFSEIRTGVTVEDEEFVLQWVVPSAVYLVGASGFNDLLSRMNEEGMRERAAVLRRQISSPLGAGLSELLLRDPLGLAQELSQAASSSGLATDAFTGAFISPDEQAALVVATPAGGELSSGNGRRILALMDEVEAGLAEKFDPEGALGIELRPLGGPLYAAWDETAIRRDLEVTLTVSLGLSLLALALGLRSLGIPVVAALTLGGAGIWTVGLLQLVGGRVTALSFGFGAVLIGLGVDALIHGAGRWRQAGSLSIAKAVGEAGPAILVALGTTACAFFTLRVASLRLVREVGLLVSIGLVAVLVASLLVAVPFAAWAERRPREGLPTSRGSDGTAALLAPWLRRGPERLIDVAVRRPLWTLGAFGLLFLTSGFFARDLRIEGQLGGLRPADHPAVATEIELFERFGIGADSVQLMVVGSDLDEALGRCRVLVDQVQASADLGVKVTAPCEILAGGAGAEQRQGVLEALPLEQLSLTLEAELRNEGLNPLAFQEGIEGVRRLAEGPMRPASEVWPLWVRRQVAEDSEGVSLLVNVRVPNPETVSELRRRVDSPDVAWASSALVGKDLETGARRDLRVLGLLSVLVVGVVLLVSYRGRLGGVVLAAVPVAFGTLASAGGLVMFGQKLDLLGVAVLPILLGIGIDDGIHATLSSSSTRSLTSSVRHIAPAMTLTTVTTVLGFGSLSLSQIPSLANAGILVAGGVATCWLATLLVLPAWDTWRRPNQVVDTSTGAS